MNQKTIANKVEGVGIGLHKGEPIKMIFEPMPKDSGILFYRSDVRVSIPAKPEYVINTQMATVIGKDGHGISTIEHLLAAVHGYGIDNLRITIDSNEVPIMDGSSASFCMMLDEAKIVEIENAPKNIIVIKKSVEVRDGDKYAIVTPSKKPKFRFKINFPHPCIGEQFFEFDFTKKNFMEYIAKARTFGFLKDAQMLRAKGLALGASLDNAIVMDDKRILNPEGLRFANEFVKHKILDAIGDLSLLGMPMLGDYESFAGSHKLNHLLTKEILANNDNYDICTLDSSSIDNSIKKVFS